MAQKRYWGMSSKQIMVLAGLAVIACLLFAVAGGMALRGSLAGPAPTPEDTPVPPPTATPFTIPSVTPTSTLTPIPYETLVPAGWVQFKTALIEIWLPKGFKKGNPKPLFRDRPDSPVVFELALQDATSKTSLYRAVAGVQYEMLTAESLDAFLDRELPGLPSDERVTERRKTTLNTVEVTRLVIESKVNNVDVITLAYVFLDGNTIWYVVYGAQINQFFEMLGTFEQSAKTFRIVR